MFNKERFLGRTLDGILGQTVPDWECVVVDDGSTDNSLALARNYALADPRIRVISQPHSGPSTARNYGYVSSNQRSKYITFLDADDVWLPQALETLRSRIERDGYIIGAHGLAEVVGPDDQPIAHENFAAQGRRRRGVLGRRLAIWPLDQPTDFNVLVCTTLIYPPGLVLVKRSAYERTGRFDEEVCGPEDWDMLIRLGRNGDLGFVNEVVVFYRLHDGNLHLAADNPRQVQLVRCKAFHSPENSPEQQRVVVRAWRALQRQFVAQQWQALIEDLRRRQLGRAVGDAVRLIVQSYRLGRGYPTPRIVSVSKPWPERTNYVEESTAGTD